MANWAGIVLSFSEKNGGGGHRALPSYADSEVAASWLLHASRTVRLVLPRILLELSKLTGQGRYGISSGGSFFFRVFLARGQRLFGETDCSMCIADMGVDPFRVGGEGRVAAAGTQRHVPALT